MNDNSGETPNPLNPSPSSDTEAAMDKTADTAQTGADLVTPQTNDTSNVPPAPTAQTATPIESLDPTGRPMEQSVDTPQSPKKPKTGLIVGIIAGCVLLICGIVAAVVLAMGMGKQDAVATAMQRIMSGEAPSKVAIDGDINIMLNNDNLPIKRINIDLDSDIMVGSMINTSSAVLSFTDKDDKDYSMKFEEIYAANGDLFFKLTDAKKAIEDSGILKMLNGTTPATNCVTDESGLTNCETPIVTDDCVTDGDSTDCVASESTSESSEINSLINNTLISVIEAIDGVYLRISSEEMNLMNNESLGNSNISCVTNLVSELDKNTNSAVQLYNKHPFVMSTNEKIPIPSKQNPIYRIWLDNENFASYIDEMQNTSIAESLYNCLGWDDNAAVTEEDVAEITDKMPNIYAEVNSENNFTRLYMESDINNGMATATIDLGFSYPNNVNVSEPVEYKDFSEIIQTLFQGMYNVQQ